MDPRSNDQAVRSPTTWAPWATRSDPSWADAGVLRHDPVSAKQFAQVTFRSDNRADLQRCSTPALVKQQTDDVIAPVAVGEYVHRHQPASSYVLLESSGHRPNLAAPEKIHRCHPGLPRRAAAHRVTAEHDPSNELTESIGDLCDKTPCGCLTIRAAGRIGRVNRTFLDLIGYKADELAGTRRFSDLLAHAAGPTSRLTCARS